MPHIHWVERQNKLEIPKEKDETSLTYNKSYKFIESIKRETNETADFFFISIFFFQLSSPYRNTTLKVVARRCRGSDPREIFREFRDGCGGN
jgi:hypothetical protein